MNFEDYCYLKTKSETYKKHWMVILGNELYFYRKRGDTEHKVMHCLTGTYLKETSMDELSFDSSRGVSLIASSIVVNNGHEIVANVPFFLVTLRIGLGVVGH